MDKESERQVVARDLPRIHMESSSNLVRISECVLDLQCAASDIDRQTNLRSPGLQVWCPYRVTRFSEGNAIELY